MLTCHCLHPLNGSGLSRADREPVGVNTRSGCARTGTRFVLRQPGILTILRRRGVYGPDFCCLYYRRNAALLFLRMREYRVTPWRTSFTTVRLSVPATAE